jgi:hypothetical protein
MIHAPDPLIAWGVVAARRRHRRSVCTVHGGFHCTPTGIPAGLKGRPTVAPHISRRARDMGHPGSWQGNRRTLCCIAG